MSEKTNEVVKSVNLSYVESDGYVSETNKIVCPYCGEQWEMEYSDYEDSPYEEREDQCLECGEYFLLDCEPETIFNFYSKRIDEVAE